MKLIPGLKKNYCISIFKAKKYSLPRVMNMLGSCLIPTYRAGV